MPADSKTQEMAEFLLKIKAEGEEEASKATAKFSKSLDGLKKSSSSVLAPIQKLSSLVSGGLGFGKSINFVEDYYKAMTKLSGQMLKYGNSAKSLEKEINSLSKTLHLTRMETIGLMSEFEKGFPLASVKAFKDIMVKISNVTGANKDAIQEYMGVLGGISNMMPELQSSMQDLNKLDKERLRDASKLMMIEGNMSLQQSKSLGSFIAQNKQVSKADEEHIKKWKSFMASMQDIRIHFEKIAMILGEAFVPLIKDISKYMTENKETINQWVSGIATVAKYLVPVVLAYKTISGFAGGIKSSVGAFGALGGKKGKGGAAGGVGGLGGKQCMPVCGAGGAGGGSMYSGVPGGAAGAGGSRSATALKATGKILGKGMAMVAGAMIGQEIGGVIGKSLGSEKTGQYLGAAAGGAATGFQVAGPVGALVGAGIGLLGQGLSDLNDWIEGPSAEQKEMNEHLKKIADNTKETKSKVKAGILTKEQGKFEKKSIRAEDDLYWARKKKQRHAVSLRKIKEAESARKEGGFRGWMHGSSGVNEQGGLEGTAMSMERSKAALRKSIKNEQEKIHKLEKLTGAEGEAERKRLADAARKVRIEAQLEAQDAARKAELINIQNIRYETQKKLVGALSKELNSEVQLMLLGKKIDDEGLKNKIEATKAAIELEKEYAGIRIGEAQGVRTRAQGRIASGKGEYDAAKGRVDALPKEVKRKMAALEAAKKFRQKREAYGETFDKDFEEEDYYKKTMKDLEPHQADLDFIIKYEGDLQTVKKSTTTINEETAHQNELIAKGNVLWKQRTAVIEIDKQLHAGTASIMEAQIGILDQMGMGIGAPAEMRYQLMQQIGMQVLEVDKQIAISKEKAAKGDISQKDAQKEINKYELERLQLIQKQYSVSKSLREGWVDALSAMTVASGRITKIMINRQSNLAEGLKQGMVTSNVSGKLGAGGGRNSERFGISLAGGLNISGGGNAGFQTDFGPDVRKVNKMHENIRKGNIDKASKIATSQGTFMANKAMSGSGTAHLKGPGLVAATQPGASGIKNVPGRNVGAGGGQPKTGERASGNIPGKDVGSGGGWAKTDKQGVTVFNVSIEVHNKAEMTKFLKDISKKVYSK